MSDTTGPQTLDQALVKIKEMDSKLKNLDSLVRGYQDSVLKLIEESDLTKDVNRIDNQLTESIEKQKKVIKVGQILMKDEQFFSNLPDQFHNIETENAKINAKMKSLHSENKKLTSTHKDINDRIQANFDHLAQHDEFNAKEPERLKQLQNIIEERCKETAELMIQTAISELEAKLNEENQKKFDDIEEEMRQIESRSNEKIQILTDRLKQAEQRIEEAKNEAIQQAAENVQDARNTIQEQGDHLTQIDETLSQLKTKDAELESDINDKNEILTKNIDGINKEIDNINDHITEHENSNTNDFKDVREEIQKLKDQDQTLDEKYKGEVDRIDKRIDESDKKHDSDLQKETQALHKRIDTMSNDISKYKETTDGHLTAHDQSIDEIHETEKKMQDDHKVLKKDLSNKERLLSERIDFNSRQNDTLSKSVRDCNNLNKEIHQHLLNIKGDEEISMSELKKITLDVQNQLKETREEVKNGIQKANEQMLSHVNNAKQQINDNVDDWKQKLANAESDIDKQLKIRINELDNKFKDYTSSIHDNAQRINETITAYFEGNSQDDDKAYPFSKSLPELITMIKDTEEKNKGIGKTLTKDLNEFSNELMQELNQLKDKIDETAKQLNEHSDEFEKFSKDITEEMSNEREKNSTNVQTQQEQLEATKNNLQDQINQAMDQLNADEKEYRGYNDELKASIGDLDKKSKKMVKNAIDQLNQEFESTKTKNEDQFTDLTDKLVKLSGESGHNVDSLLTEMQTIDERLTQAIQNEKQATDGQFEAVSNYINKKIEKCTKANEKTEESLRSTKEELTGKVVDLEKKSLESLNKVQTQLQNSINEVDGKFEKFVGGYQAATLSTVFEKISKDTASLDDKIKENTARIEGAEKASNDNFDLVSKQFKKIQEKQKDHQTSINTLSQSNVSLEEKINNNINEQVQSLLQQINNQAEAINAQFGEVQNSFKTVGEKMSRIKEDNKQKLKEMEDRNNNKFAEQKGSFSNELNQKETALIQKIDNVNKSLELLKGKDGISIPSIMESIANVEKQFNQSILNLKTEANTSIQNTQKEIEGNRESFNERIEQLHQELIDKSDSYRTLNAEQQKENQKAIGKIESSFAKKLKKIDTKIDDLNGGSDINLKTIVDQFNQYRSDTNKITADHKAEIDSIRNTLIEQPGKIKKELTNDFLLRLNTNKTENEKIAKDLNDFEARLRQAASNKQVEELFEVIGELQNNTIRELKEKDEALENQFNESIESTRKEIEQRLDKHQDELNSIREDLTKFNGGSGESLGQIAKRLDALKKEHQAVVKHLGQVETDLNNKITITQTNLNSESDNFKKELMTTNQKFTENHQTLNHDIDANKKSFEKANAQLRTLIENLETSSSAKLENAKTEINTRISTLEATSATTIEAINNDFAKSKADFNDLSKAFIDSTTKIKNHISKISDKMKSERELTDKNIDIKANQVTNEFTKQIKSVISTMTENQNASYQKVTDTLNTLRADFDQLKGESELTLPLIDAKFAKTEDTLKEYEKEAERNAKIQKDDLDANLENYTTNTKQALVQLKQMVKEVKDRQTKSEQTKDETENKIRLEFENDMNILEKRITKSIDAVSKEFNTKLIEVNDKSRQDNSKINDTFTNVNTQFSELKSQFDNLKATQASNFKTYIAKIDQRVDDRNKKAQDDVAQQIQKVDKKLNQNSEAFDQICKDIETKLGANQEKTHKLYQKSNETLEALKGEVNEFQNEIVSQLQEKLDKFKGDIKKLNELIATNKNEADKYYEKVSTDSQTIQNKINENKQVMFDEFDAVRKELNQTVKKLNSNLNSFIENQKQQNEADKENWANMQEEHKQELIEINEDMNKQILSEIETIRTDLDSRTESTHKDITDIKDKFNKVIAPKLNSLIDQINGTNERFDDFENTTGKKVNQLMKRHEDEKSTKDSLSQFVKRSEEKIERFTSNINKEFVQAKISIDSVTAKATQELTDMHNEVETVKQDMRELSRIKRLNADCEKINMKFETALSNLQTFQRTIFNYVMPDHQNISCQNSRYTFTKKQVESSFKPSQRDRYEITDDLNTDVDLGLTLRKAFQDHSYVVLTIPKNQTFKWNETVQLNPNQALEIRGEKRTTSQPSIVIDGYNKLNNELFDLSRVVIDGFGSLKLRNLKIQANLNLPFPLRNSMNKKESSLSNRMKYAECMDLSALFVSRCWDASGPATIDIDSCMFEIDIPIINIGANSFCNIRVANSDISAKKGKGDQTIIYPITCENGGYKQGYGNVSLNNVNIMKPKVQWLETPYLNQPDLLE